MGGGGLGRLEEEEKVNITSEEKGVVGLTGVGNAKVRS